MKTQRPHKAARNPEQGWTVWLTGLSGAGKTTLARALQAHLERLSIDCELIDGDEIRRELCRDLGFSKEDREENIRRVAYLAQTLNRHGIVCVVAAISPFRAARDQARKSIPKFLEIYVDCPLDTLLKRDTKGLYRRALDGDLPNFTGISSPYEVPLSPDVHINSGFETKNHSLAAILAKLEALKWLPSESNTSMPINIRKIRGTLPV